jgi:hypothetical protein
MKSKGIRVDDCLALLSYCAKHRGELQSFPIFEEVLGIPHSTLFLMLTDAAEQGGNSLLHGVALHYGFSYRLVQRRNGVRVGLIDVVTTR